MFRGLVIAALLASATARADDGIATYAIVVGSNAGGPGQTDLHYAEEDARRVAQLLTELGGYAPAQVDVVVHPTPDQLRERLASLDSRVQADVAAGRQARVFFYYSGHARAQAIDLGSSELPLDELRERLFKVPATLTVVVLDACQSGAFSRVKGAAPAADFSFSSRQHLDAAGIAVLASSSGSELSQESEQLRGSYFTHNLLVGLRGAGDANNDGQVTIDEAYRYAYNQTLLATAETAVGGQHVTFEADLKGHGEVPLSFPRAASAAIVLPPALQGKALVSDRRAHEVVAEIYKAKGAPVRIAVAPGEYDVLVRDGDTLVRCDVVAPGMVDLGTCQREAVIASATKGGGFERPWRIELGGGIGGEREDAYTKNLSNFGYLEDTSQLTAFAQVTALRQVADHFYVGAQVAWMSLPDWRHDITGGSPLFQELTWSATTFGAFARAIEPLWSRWGNAFGIYAQGMLGAGVGVSDVRDTNGALHGQSNTGYAVSGGGGFYVDTRFGIGMLVGDDYDYAPVITDLIGNTHAVGGNRATVAFSVSF
jgi:hypothetical protein